MEEPLLKVKLAEKDQNICITSSIFIKLQVRKNEHSLNVQYVVRSGVANREDRVISRWASLMYGPQGQCSVMAMHL